MWLALLQQGTMEIILREVKGSNRDGGRTRNSMGIKMNQGGQLPPIKRVLVVEMQEI